MASHSRRSTAASRRRQRGSCCSRPRPEQPDSLRHTGGLLVGGARPAADHGSSEDESYHTADEDFDDNGPWTVDTDFRYFTYTRRSSLPPWPPARTAEEDGLIGEMREAILQHGGQSAHELQHMSEIYGGHEWMLLRFLRVAGGNRHNKVDKAVVLYMRTVEWRKQQRRCVWPDRSEPEPEPEQHTEFVAPPCARITAAATAVLEHEMAQLAPFKVYPRPAQGLMLLCGNVEYLDPAPIRALGFDRNFDFFVAFYEYVTLMHRCCFLRCGDDSDDNRSGVATPLEDAYFGNRENGQCGQRCHGDVAVVDTAALAWRHIDVRLFHRVLVPILQAWQAHYPETLHKAYVLNAPTIFELVWKIVRPVLSDRVVARIVIATDDREDELRTLLGFGKDDPLPWLVPQAGDSATLEDMTSAVLST